MTTESKLELFKLDPIDQKTLFWMMDNKPDSVRTWINHISRTYKNRILIDPEKFFNEVAPELDEDFNQSPIEHRTKKILLVDDDKTFNFLHTRILEITGVAGEINIALNGNQAINSLMKLARENNLPDIILLDLSMPVMDGFDFLEAFKQSNIPDKEKITIIVITSSNDYRDKNRASNLGIEHFLSKPVNENELYQVVVEASAI